MKNFSKIVDNFDVTTKKYVDDGLAEKANSADLATVANGVSGKLDKTGGTITGNLTVGGNLTVSGTTTTVDSTTLQVKDKLIEVAHGNTAALTTPAGLVAPKYDGTNSGALVFDSTGTAYVGDVTLKDGNIDVANSQLQPLATRTGLVGGNLVQYDSSALTLKDSGKKISDLATTSQVNAKYAKPSDGIPKTDLASDVQTSLGKADNALSLDGGTIKKSKTIKMDASANSDGANLKWGTVNSKNPYIGYASDQVDGTFVVGSLLGTNYASGLAIGGGSGNLLWKGTKVATTSDIPTVNNGTLTIQKNGTDVATFGANQSTNTTANITVPTKVGQLENDSGYTTNKGTVTQVKINGTTNSPDSAGLVDLGTVGGSSDNSKHGYTELTNENLNTITEAGWYRAASNSPCANKPTAFTSFPFILEVEKSADVYIKQTTYTTENSSDAFFTTYVRFSIDSGSTWTSWEKNQTMSGGKQQTFSGLKTFNGGINVFYSPLRFNSDAGSGGKVAMSQGATTSPKWVNLQVRVNGTTYTADSDGLIDLGEISGGGGGASTSQYNDIY